MNPDRPGRARTARRVTLAVLGFTGSTAAYYAARAVGAGPYVALLAGAVVSLAPQVVPLLRGRPPDAVGSFAAMVPAAGLAVALLPGDPRFLMAKGALVTALVGTWMGLTCLPGRRPLVFRLSRFSEGRWGWPGDWDGLWATCPPFRRAWRRAGAVGALALFLDAGTRVAMAYSLPVDAVPLLGRVVSVLTLAVAAAAITVLHVRAGTFTRPGP